MEEGDEENKIIRNRVIELHTLWGSEGGGASARRKKKSSQIEREDFELQGANQRTQ